MTASVIYARVNDVDEKTAAIFARVSSIGQKDNYSFAGQEADSRAYADRMHLEVIHVFTFVESAHTKDVSEREDLQQLLDLVASKTINAIILGKFDRLTRRSGTLGVIWRACKDNNVELHFADLGKADDSYAGKLLLQMLESFAEYEADMIAARMQGGKRTKIASGRVLGIGACGPYGHKFVGTGKDKQLVIDPDEAKIVRLMRDWVLYEGMGTQKIAKRLTEMKIATPGSTRKLTTRLRGTDVWSVATVYRTITNHSIAGVYYHDRYKRKKNSTTAIKTDPSMWSKPIPIDAIITMAEFEGIKQKLADNRTFARRTSDRFYLLSKRIKCACGYSISGEYNKNRGSRQYRCSGSRSLVAIPCRPTVSVSADTVERAVWQWLLGDLSPDKIRAGLLREREQTTDKRGRLQRQVALQEAQLSELNTQLAQIRAAYIGRVFTLEETQAERTKVDKAIETCQREISKLHAQLADVGPSDQEIANLASEVAELQDEAQYVTDPEKQRWIIDKLDVRVVIERDGDTYYASIAYKLGGTKQPIPITELSR